MSFNLFIERNARKQLDELPKKSQERILENLREAKKGLSARLDIKKLKGTKNHYRLRVGNYRILLVIENYNIYIYDVSHRKQAYK